MQHLPMLGLTHGNRSAVTCHLKCDSACAHPVPNTTAAPTFREIASGQLTRRSLLVGAGALTVAAALPVSRPQTAAAAPVTSPAGSGKVRAGGLSFTPIVPVEKTVDALTVPTGYRYDTILRWGDPLFHTSPAFDPTQPNADAQELQFGYNNDYLDILVTDRRGRRGILVCNHEYTNRGIMFPPTEDDAAEAEVLRTLQAAHGMSVVQLRRSGRGRAWRYVRGGWLNRRITANSLFELTGPAAGSDLVKTAQDPTGTRVKGTFGNCSGGTTPWGTVLSGEENVNGYFKADPDAKGSARYGLTAADSVYGWEKIDPRFDATGEDFANEPHRFGYIVEIDPTDPDSTPRKHTAMGRFKHEGANVIVGRDGTVAAYMGDDERFDYLYKFVSRYKHRAGNSWAARQHNLKLLTEGDLYVARFSGTMKPGHDNLGQGVWIPLTLNGRSMVPGFSLEEVLVYTRLAADTVTPTKMDRCEDVQPSLKSGKIYVACTNNTRRTAEQVDAANPRPANKDGHIIEITEYGSHPGATTFAWDLFMVCGDPEDSATRTYFAGWDGTVAPISCPDNVAFDSAGNLWISTDGQPGTIDKNDGLFTVPVTGAERGHLVQFLAVPVDAETCGPVIHDRDQSVFVAVQHPGEDGTWDEPTSYFPDYVPAGYRPRAGDWRGPRPSVVQITVD